MLRAVVAISLLVAVLPARATWKPEYATAPEAVKHWFEAAQVNGGCSDKGAAFQRLGICLCCKWSERLMTKFVASPGHQWSYYPDSNCTVKGCPLKPIPDDVVHEDEIRALDPADDALPEFDAMRRQGVLFIYHGEPSCFWPPQATDQ